MPFDSQAEQDALTLLSALVRLDTTNPPGNERAAAELLAASLREAGLEPQLLEKEPGRANLVVRLRGDGSAGGPLLLSAQLDVAAARAEGSKHPPFSAEIDDGWLYGRGAAGAKSFAAAAAMVVRQLAREKAALKRDLILVAAADTGAGGDLGARFLVDEHPESVRAEWGLCATGGHGVRLDGKRLYPIPVAHKGCCWISLKARGPQGHAARPRHDASVLRLARALARLGNRALPVHACEPTRRMLRALSRAQGLAARPGLAMLARPALADFALESVVGDAGLRRLVDPLLRNTVAATALRGGEANDAIPGEVEARLVGFLLPGQSTANLLGELKQVIDDAELTLTVLREYVPATAPADSPLFARLAAAVRELDPEGIAIPGLSPATADTGAFGRLGTHFYGFSPVRLPDAPDADLAGLQHGDDERLPVDGWKAGLRALFSAVSGFCTGLPPAP